MCGTGKLKDSCLEYKLSSNEQKDVINNVNLGTNERAGNSYSDPAECAKNPDGKRIDYILYHAGDNYKVCILYFYLKEYIELWLLLKKDVLF